MTWLKSFVEADQDFPKINMEIRLYPEFTRFIVPIRSISPNFCYTLYFLQIHINFSMSYY